MSSVSNLSISLNSSVMATELSTGRSPTIHRCVVTAEQMRAIEERMFAEGMPVAALMEKVAGLIARRVKTLQPKEIGSRVGVLVGAGHNGGDALVVARELHHQGYRVQIYQAFERLKELTAAHANYASHLGIPIEHDITALSDCDWFLDGLFGFGLTRSLDGSVARAIEQVNEWGRPVISIDVPSGLHTDTGAVMGTAVRATHTLCLGLWKRAFVQDSALAWVGQAELIDFDIPLTDIAAVLGDEPSVQRITAEGAIAALPLPRAVTTHKYKEGHLLLICGSRTYGGAALLATRAARASGVGMLSVAVPHSLKPLLTAQVPEALVIDCPETESGAIAQIPDHVNWGAYQAIACGCGLTRDAVQAIHQALESDAVLLLDADGLNVLAAMDTPKTLSQRSAKTVLTPHLGEFKRLYPAIESQGDRLLMAQQAALSGAIVLLKGAQTVIASGDRLWVNPASTPALARGGSGDVLTGLLGGLLAQAVAHSQPLEPAVQVATWWHAQAGLLAAKTHTELGADASAVIDNLSLSLVQQICG